METVILLEAVSPEPDRLVYCVGPRPSTYSPQRAGGAFPLDLGALAPAPDVFSVSSITFVCVDFPSQLTLHVRCFRWANGWG